MASRGHYEQAGKIGGDESNRTVLHFRGGMRLSMNVGDLLSLSAPSSATGKLCLAPHKEEVP